MSITNAFASVGVKDLASAIMWYERLIGRPADSMQVAGVAEWRFELGGSLQVYPSPERAGFGSFTLAVSSLEEQSADLKRCGIATGPPLVTEMARVLMIKDPDGNSIAFAESKARPGQ
jgi:predicted enzyme related to lactoylglutathione lyase